MYFMCLTVLVNCLLNAFAIGVGEVTVFSFGMLCLSAWRMMFVKIVFAVCMSGGG